MRRERISRIPSVDPWIGGAATILLLSLCACSGDREVNEARLFLDRYDTLQHPSIEVRRSRLDAFRAMAFRSEEVRAAQTRCVELHQAVLDAELASTRAADELGRVEAGAAPPSGVEALLRQSQEAVGRAEESREGCDQALAELRTRHGRQP
ncbi:MAG: hypothetical protein AAGE52_00545 [Myxococcota bacterium]